MMMMVMSLWTSNETSPRTAHLKQVAPVEQQHYQSTGPLCVVVVSKHRRFRLTRLFPSSTEAGGTEKSRAAKPKGRKRALVVAFLMPTTLDDGKDRHDQHDVHMEKRIVARA